VTAGAARTTTAASAATVGLGGDGSTVTLGKEDGYSPLGAAAFAFAAGNGCIGVLHWAQRLELVSTGLARIFINWHMWKPPLTILSLSEVTVNVKFSAMNKGDNSNLRTKSY
jgi:hypothetical protein